MLAKLNKIELSEEFMVIRRETTDPLGCHVPFVSRKKMKKTKVLEAATERCSVKKVFLEISKKFTGEHLCQSLFFNKVAGLVKFLRTPFLTKHLRVTSSKV